MSGSAEGRPGGEGAAGLDQEIAVLRLRVLAGLSGTHPDARLLAGTAQGLVRAVAAQYRLSPKARDDLAEGMAAVLNSFGDLILPAEGPP